MDYFATASRLLQRSLDNSIDSADLDTVIAWPNDHLPILFGATDQVRRKFFGAAVDPCAIMNIKSGACSEDCAFCAQSGHNGAEVKVSPLASADEILAAYNRAHNQGLSFCVVSSGRRLSRDEIVSLSQTLRACGGPTHASLGILDEEEFRILKEAGVVCYNHNLETSRAFYPRIVSTHDFQDRVDTVQRAKKAGLHVCCGGILGLGESWEDRKSLCLELRKLDVDTIPLNFLNAVPGTRLEKPKESAWDFLKCVALFRLANPTKVVKVAGGREVHLGRLQPLMFFAGANGYIIAPHTGEWPKPRKCPSS